MSQKEIEHQALVFTTFMNCLITLAGLWIWRTTGIQALFLDFFFSAIALFSTFMASVISRVSIRKTEIYPEGMHFLEPLYAILKTTLVVSLLISSVYKTAVTAYRYFKYGIGEIMNLRPILPYTISMFILCSAISINNTWKNRKINNISTVLKTEAKMNFVDGLQSLVIGVATLFLLLSDINGPFGFLYYTGDFFMTLILVAVTIKNPISEIIYAFKELTGGINKDAEIDTFINDVLKSNLIDLTYESFIYKEGMFLTVRIKMKGIISEDDLQGLAERKEAILNQIRTKYENTVLEYVF